MWCNGYKKTQGMRKRIQKSCGKMIKEKKRKVLDNCFWLPDIPI